MEKTVKLTEDQITWLHGFLHHVTQTDLTTDEEDNRIDEILDRMESAE